MKQVIGLPRISDASFFTEAPNVMASCSRIMKAATDTRHLGFESRGRRTGGKMERRRNTTSHDRGKSSRGEPPGRNFTTHTNMPHGFSGAEYETSETLATSPKGRDPGN